jgi:hypothetical protein
MKRGFEGEGGQGGGLVNNLGSERSQPPEMKTERREKKRRKRRAKMIQHGKSLARVYKDAVRKRADR